jgi:hypothetical protein
MRFQVQVSGRAVGSVSPRRKLKKQQSIQSQDRVLELCARGV